MVFPIRSNPLIYPAGIWTEFNTTHIAANNIGQQGGMVAIPSSATSYVDLLHNRFSSNSIITSLTDGILGPAPNFLNSGSQATFTQANFSAPPSITLGTIVKFSTVAGGIQSFLGSVAVVGDLLLLNSGALNYFAGSFVVSGFTPTVNVPYFIVASMLKNVNVNFVVKNLLNGSVYSNAVSTAVGTTGSSSNTCIIGNNNGGQGGLCSIAAAMINCGCYLSMNELLQWAQDPWSFWYPRINMSRVAAAVAAAAGGAFSVIQDSAQGSVEMIGY